MFFFLSKTLYYLVLPVTIIFIFLLALFFVRRKFKKKLLTFTLLIFFIFSNDFLGNVVLKSWELEPIPYKEITQTYDLGIVLTGILQNEQKPYDRPFFNKGADRVFHTFQLYQKGIIDKILISGGVGRLVEVDYKEGENIKQIFLTMGVPEEDLITEVDSRNTAESAANVSKFVSNNQKLLLITSAFHMRRARGSFFKQNLKVDIFPVDYYTDQRLTLDSYFIPQLNGLQKWSLFLQEVVGYVAYKTMGYL